MLPPCPDGVTNCAAFQRLIDRGYRLEDRCHVRLFAHPARNRSEKMSAGYTPFVYDKKFLIKQGLQPNVDSV